MIVLLSGGLDSTVLLAHARDSLQNEACMALSIDYGQLHKKELECAEWQAEYYGVPWKRLDIRSVFDGIKTPLLGHGEIPEKSYKEQLDEKEGTVTTYVPNRNMILLSIAAAHAIQQNQQRVAYAAHMDDAERGAYPDCTPEFFKDMNEVLHTQGLILYAPFLMGRWTKQDIVRKGLDLHVHFEHTWSCYKGGEKPCGVCGTCRDRAAAFEANKAEDPAYA